MVVGQPGSMKSAFTMWMCDQWNLPTLYLCADMSAHTAVTRLASLRTGVDHEQVSRAFERNDAESAYIEDELSESQIRFIFDDAPSLEDIEEELAAWIERFDDYPEVLVIDNLIDLDQDSDDEYGAWQDALQWFKSLCRRYGMTIIVIHHARELEKSDYPSPRKDIQGKVTKTPELVLSVALTPSNQFRVAPVKNRTGPQDPMARKGIEFTAYPSSMSFQANGRYEKPEGKASSW